MSDSNKTGPGAAEATDPKILADAHAAGRAEVTEIAFLCTLAGKPALAAEFIAKGKSLAEVRQTLQDAKAAEGGEEISNGTLPTTGAKVGLDAATNPLIAACEKMAAEKSMTDGGPLVLLARPLADRATPSVAGTRWLVTTVRGEHSSIGNPRWGIEVLRWKGRGKASPSGLSLAASGGVGRQWTLEWRHAEGDVVESSVVVDGPSESQHAPPGGVLSGSGPPEFVDTILPPRIASVSAL